MFVIPCKFSDKFNYIIPLVEQIRSFHPTEEIVVVDSKSDDKSYFDQIRKQRAIVEDIGNTCYDMGAYWHAYKKYPNEPYYYFMHDSMKVKANLDELFKPDEVEVKKVALKFEIPHLTTKLTDMELTVRSLNCLRAAGLDTVEDLLNHPKHELLKFRNFGIKSLQEMEEVMLRYGIEY